MTRRATDVAKAVNMLFDFSGDDQEALLDVIQDYFCEPDPVQEDEEDEIASLYIHKTIKLTLH